MRSSAGPDGETGRPPLWRGLRESEESLPQTVAVSGDGEDSHVLFYVQEKNAVVTASTRIFTN